MFALGLQKYTAHKMSDKTIALPATRYLGIRLPNLYGSSLNNSTSESLMLK